MKERVSVLHMHIYAASVLLLPTGGCAVVVLYDLGKYSC